MHVAQCQHYIDRQKKTGRCGGKQHALDDIYQSPFHS